MEQKDHPRERMIPAVVAEMEGPATDHGSLAPTHEGRDKGAASGRSPNFAGCATKRGAVAAQGPPQLSDAGDLRRKLVGVGGREHRLSARGTRQRRGQPASQPTSQPTNQPTSAA
ncbi:hypothetical protein K0M31_007564 [Melipona bicolor]|uniref:Uncharacterized protein n=1 Tax=Melipona bicolor TaxID=60889 RepID=A0AA40GC04_9HYME|nr:hypothetical protein K0M31_007564 [Melipona bicolor]